MALNKKIFNLLLVSATLYCLVASQDPGEGGPVVNVDASCGGSCESGTYPSIKAAMSALTDVGGTLVLGSGVFIGPDNKNIDIGVPVTIRSATLDPASATVDCEGDGYGFISNGQSILFQGFTIINCVRSQGAALNVVDGVNTTLVNMVFAGNTATENGGAVWQSGGGLNVVACQFNGNTGAALVITGAVANVAACQFNDNSIDGTNVIVCLGGGSIALLDGTSINNQGFDAIAGALCADCSFRVDAMDYCGAPTNEPNPVLPVSPPVTAPVQPQPQPQAPVAPSPVAPSPVAPVAPVPSPTPTTPGSPYVPVFEGIPSSSSSLAVNVLVIVGTSLIMAIIN